jgi:WhiB family transcriptional regulator, redox-sensing transcriptional regulator
MTAPQPAPADRIDQFGDGLAVDRPGRLGPSDLHSLFTVEGRLFETDEATPCRVSTAGDLWFSPFRDRERAARQCQQCPFLGRCGYNAVAARATHGVWGGEILPGDKPADLEPIYARLLAQFEQRRPVELGDAPAPPMPAYRMRRRRRSGEEFSQ